MLLRTRGAILRGGAATPSLLARRAPSALAVRAKSSTPKISDQIFNDTHLFPDQVLEEEKLVADGTAGYHMGSPGGLPLKIDRELWKDSNSDELVRSPCSATPST